MEATPPIWRQFVILFMMSTLLLAAAWWAGIDPTVATVLWALGLGVGVLLVVVHGSRIVTEPKADENRAKPETDPMELIAAGAEALDIPVVILRDDSTVVSQNSAAQRAFGSIAVGSHVSARWRSPGIMDIIRETIATGEPNQIEHSERLPSERVYIVRIAPVELPEGRVRQTLFLLSFRDISELRRLDRMRTDFVANASHELRTPLASLRGFLETLQGPARNDHQAQERFISIMLDQVNRMSRLVNDLLSLSRLELKAHLAPDEIVNLGPVLSYVLDSLSPLAANLGVEVRLHIPDHKVEVVGDRDELIQVFENLIENACKYGQEGKFVDVYLRGGDGALPAEVSVIDLGPGIPAEHVPRLTERFYRVNVADSQSKKGTGLGLAIVKHILTRHRARLLVKSELGKGTDFIVRF